MKTPKSPKKTKPQSDSTKFTNEIASLYNAAPKFINISNFKANIT